MAGFLSIPLKKSYEVDAAGPIRTFISSTYSTTDMPTDYDSINDFNKLRSKACVQPLDKHESSLDLLYRYYDQLMAIEGKLPLTPTQIPIPFKWKDSFERGGLFGGKASLTLSHGSYEKACVLFNISALQSQIASSQRLDTDDELKLAAKLFMQGAGILNYLKDSVLSMVQQEPTADLMPDTLSALSALMVAQAQEAIYLKAAKDQMKPALIAKIAAQAADFYADAAKQCGRDVLRGLWEKDWMPTINGKNQAFLALSQYHQSLVCKENKDIGEELARLTNASQIMAHAQQLLTNAHLQLLKSETTAIQKSFESAKKDNDFIYHERIPDLKTVPAIQKAALAKPQPLGAPMSRSFKDLFEKLTPIAVQQALARYDARRSQLIQGEIGRCREHTNLMNTILASLNLPAALEDATSREALPESIREKSTKIKGMGGVQNLDRIINELPTLLKRNQEILEETRRLLNEERSSDDQLRAQFKERWTRMPSEKLTEPLFQEIGKYGGILETAMNADKIVRQKFEANHRGFEILSKTEPELKSAIPGLGAGSGGSDSSAITKLKQLLTEVDDMRQEREQLENEFKNKTFDMSTVFLKALAESGAINDEAISLEKLNEVYGPMRTMVSDSIQRQERVMGEVQSANDQFVREKGTSGGADRENMLKMLVTAHDSYLELNANLEEGTKFYNDLTPLLVRLQQKVSDFCFARKTEKEDLFKDLQLNIVGQSSSAPPNQPAFHGAGTTTTTASQPPARPPPPRFANAPTQQQGAGTQQTHQQTPYQQPQQQYQPYGSAPPQPQQGSYPPQNQQGNYPPGNQPYVQPYNPYPYASPAQTANQQPYSNVPPYPYGTQPQAPYPVAGGMPGYPPQPMPGYPYPNPQQYPPQQQGYPGQPPQQHWPQQ